MSREGILTQELLNYDRLWLDFDILQEVKGRHLIEGVKLRIDLMMHPKQHLVDLGFDDVWFGVEVKSTVDKNGMYDETNHKHLIWQCINYAQSTFEINGQSVRPPFVLMYTDRNTLDWSTNHADWQIMRALTSLAQFANVGFMLLHKPGNYRIKFGTAGYYDSEYGRGKTNAGIKRYVGTSGNDRGYVTGGGAS